MVVAAAGCHLFFHDLAVAPLAGDEAIHAQVARESAERDHRLPLTLEGRPYTEKPPLKILAVAWIFDKFGVGEFQARFLDAAFGVATLLLVFLFGVRLVGPWSAALAALLLASDPLYVLRHCVREGVQDSALVFFMTASLALYFLHSETGRAHRLLLAGAGVALGLAGLVKGPPAALALLILVAWEVTAGRRAGSRWAGARDLATVALIALAFYLPYVLAALSWTEGAFSGLLYDDIVVRATESVDPSHVQGPLFYVRQLGVEFGPWLLAAIPSLAVVAGRVEERERRERIGLAFCSAWALTLLATVSLSTSKLPWYLYPAYPALVLVLAAGIGATARRAAAWRRAPRVGGALAAALVVASVAGVWGRFVELKERLDIEPLETRALRYARVIEQLPSAALAIDRKVFLDPAERFYLLPLGRRSWGVPARFGRQDHELCRFLVRRAPWIPPAVEPGPGARALPLTWPETEAWLLDLDGCLPSWV